MNSDNNLSLFFYSFINEKQFFILTNRIEELILDKLENLYSLNRSFYKRMRGDSHMIKKYGIASIIFYFLYNVFGMQPAKAQNSYVIYSCADLQNMKNDVSGAYTLANDIDCAESKNWNNGKGFEPIGLGAKSFSGILNGQGHTIDQLTIRRGEDNFVGFFGYLSQNSVVKNIIIKDAVVKGNDYVGGLVGFSFKSTIENVKVVADVTGNNYVGGMIGLSGGSTGTNMITNGFITGNEQVGGVVGWAYEGSIFKNGYSLATVKGGNFVGGFAGMVNTSSKIENSYAKGYVFGVYRTGGFVGDVNISGEVRNVYATGLVRGGTETGGLIGRTSGSGYEYNSYWDKQTSRQPTSAKGKGYNTNEMKKQSTFVPWDFSAIWGVDTLKNQGYPYLKQFVYDETIPNEITNLKVKHKSSSSVSLQWENPTDSDFYKVRIYRDGEFVEEARGGSFAESNLQKGKMYTYLLVAVDVNGNESIGKTIQVEAMDVEELFVEVPQVKKVNDIQLNGSKQVIATAFDGTFVIGDRNRLGNGWNLMVKATPFREIGGKKYVFPIGSLILKKPKKITDITDHEGSLPIVESENSWVIDGGNAVRIMTAKPKEAIGMYEVEFPMDALEITLHPEHVYIDKENDSTETSYVSTITFEIVSGP